MSTPLENNSDETNATAAVASTVAAPAAAAQAEATHTRIPSFDMESLLRQWGGASASLDTDELEDPSYQQPPVAYQQPPLAAAGIAAGVEGMEGGGGEVPHPLMGRSHSTTPNAPNINENVSDSTAAHRRIASTGGNRHQTPPLPPSSTLRPSLLCDSINPLLPTDSTEQSEGTELHSAARITDWNLVASLSKAANATELAKYRGPDGWTALHHACSRRCPRGEVIEGLLRAFPEALLCVDDRGWTPLHHASRFKAPLSVLRLLLRLYPQIGSAAAKIRCSTGRSALYYAIRYEAPAGVVELLLQSDPGAVMDEDRDGICVLGLVWDGYANSFAGKRDLKALLRKFEGEADSVGGVQQQGVTREELNLAEKRVKEAIVKDTPTLRQLQSKWRIVNNLLRAYFHFPIQSLGDAMEDNLKSEDGQKQRKWRILHAVSAIKCHPTLFLLARALHPEQAKELDENDLLGVGHHDGQQHTIAQSPEKQPISNRTALHFAAMSPLSGKDGRNVIKALLSLYPEAPSRVDGYGSLPLHLMAENDHKVHWIQDGFRDVYSAYTEASSSRDGLGRTPLHCATSCSGRYSTASSPQSTAPTAEEAPAPRDMNAAARNIGSVILNLVIVNRASASIADNTGRLPLHYIAEHGEEWSNDAESILAAHPAASRTRAGSVSYNQLPLHMAASNPDACPSLIMNIVNANPRAASLTDGTGRLPLHLACDSGRTTWERGIESIYNAYHAAISVQEDSRRGWTVLHTAAASHSAGKDLIQNVLNLNRGAAGIADGEGRYPLHLACGAGRHWEEGVRMLFEADPSAALMEDMHGFLPVHIVAMKSTVSPSSLLNDVGDEGVEDKEASSGGEGMEGGEEEDLAQMEVLFNLLIAQPSTVQLR